MSPEANGAAHSAFDHLTGMVGSATASAQHTSRAMARGHSEITACLTEMMRETAEQMAGAFEEISRSPSPSEAAQRYMGFLIAMAQHNVRQMGEIGRVMAQNNARLFQDHTGR